MTAIQRGDRIVLVGPEGERHVVDAADETRRVAGLGVLALSDLVGRPWGDRVRLGLKDYRLLRPVLADHVDLIERRAQIILPKDAARILYETGLATGHHVVEGGVGSGALTLVMAHAVAPGGRVYAYDLRDDHLAVGRRNLEAAGLAGAVEFRQGDVRKSVPHKAVDAFVVDVPDPEATVPTAHDALRSGGVFAAYTPLIGQAEAASRSLRKEGFLEVRTLETLEREWVLHERGSRPAFEMLGHTGFLTFARRP